MQYTIKSIQQDKISEDRYKSFAQEWNRRKDINPKTAIIMCIYLALLLIFGITIIIVMTNGGI